MTDTPELLPCPFCGGEARPDAQTHMGRNYVGIICLGCGLWQDTRSPDVIGAIAAWNRRADSAERDWLAGEVARLREALKVIASSHWERFGMDQTDIEQLPDLSADEAMNAARDALSYDDNQPTRAALTANHSAPVVD